MTSRLLTEPLLLSPSHVDVMAAVVDGKFDQEGAGDYCALAGPMFGVGFSSAAEKSFPFADGLAFIPIRGALLNRSMAMWSYATGYRAVLAAASAAAADPEVKGFILDVDSYGGEAAGCFECAAELREIMRASGKPSLSVVDSNAYSAGYALAVAADRVVVVPSGGVGSIGVLTMHVDVSKAMGEAGVKVTYVFAGKHKVDGNPYEPLPEAVRASIQERISTKYEAFVAHVATMRGIAAQVLRDTEAKIYDANAAIALGLVDSAETPRKALAQFRDSLIAPLTGALQLEATMPADHAELNAARSEERARCRAILGHAEATGRGDLAAYLAFDTDMPAEQAGAMLSRAPKAAPAPTATSSPDVDLLATAMAAAGSPNVGIDAKGDATNIQGVDEAASILAAYTLATGVKTA